MRETRLAVLSLSLLLGSCQAGGPGREVSSGGTLSVSGRVMLADGSVPELAHVHWSDPQSRELEHLATDAEGRFRIELPVGEELPQFAVSAPFHGQVSVEIPPGAPHREAAWSGERYELTLRLARYRVHSPLEEVEIVGDWNDFDFSSAEPMEQQDDGTFVYTVAVPESGRVAYQVLGAEADGRSINGTQADAFEYDGFGDYRSILLGESGETLQIRFDPARLHGGTRTRQVELESNPPLLGQAFALLQALAATRRELSERDAREPEELPRGATNEAYAALRGRLVSTIRDSAVPVALREYAASLLLNMPEEALTDELIELALDGLPVRSPVWSRNTGDLLDLQTPEHRDLLEQLGESHPSLEVRVHAIGALAQAAKRAGDATRWHVLAERFRQETDDPAEQYSWLWGQIDPQARIQVGHLVPEFSVARLDGAGEITEEDLQGRYTLLDFWGTWCGPCVRELPELHAAWERFEDENFQIVSIAFDEPAEAVEEFRAERFPMPWEHAVVEQGMDSQVAKTFEIAGIPRPILVGPDGTILAMEGDLRGDDLEPTLERFLSPAS